MNILCKLLCRLNIEKKIEFLLKLNLIYDIFNIFTYHEKLIIRKLAIIYDNIDIIKFLHNNNILFSNDIDVSIAIENKSHNVLRFFCDLNYSINPWFSINAIENNDLETFKIFKEFNYDIHDWCFAKCIGLNNTVIFNFLINNYYHVVDFEDCFFVINMIDNPIFLDIIKNKGYNLRKDHLDEAGRLNKILLFNYLLSNGIKPDERTMERTVKGNSIDCVKILLKKNCKWDMFSYNASIGLEFNEITKLLENDARTKNKILESPQIINFNIGF